MQKTAIISDCTKYRYQLSRIWDPNKPLMGWIMLNPSTADADKDDPTIRKCVGFAERWEYGGIVVTNLFAVRATDPKEMMKADSPIGDENDSYILSMLSKCKIVVAAWGTKGNFESRNEQVESLVSDYSLLALKLTKAGHPSHPLYIPYDILPVVYKGIKKWVITPTTR